ncbi:MAG TPA: hypothetical protein VN736_24310 [Candidatus Limnocylindrales bacterium]|nr:hypothetical protein [Candidatus Limnocylindrales bacterium]
MPIRFHYDPELRILFTTAEGSLTLAEILHHLAEEKQGRGLRHRELLDGSHAHLEMTSDEVRTLVERLHAMQMETPFGPTAVVVSSDYFFGMASMLAILSELRGGPTIGVFRGVNEALEWLVRIPPSA